MKRFLLSFIALTVIGSSVFSVLSSSTASASREDIISDSIFGNDRSMTEDQIHNFINSFPKSCLRPENYPANLSYVTWKEPLGYFEYGNDVSPARIIWKAATLYRLNPQVLLATLEKEQGIVSGNAYYGCIPTIYNSAMGYNCPDGSENALKNYESIGVTKTCVARESNVTFSRQVNHAAWQLSFDAHRANGDLAWMGDGATYYGGFMTQGTRARIQGGTPQYYDGIAIIDGVPLQLANGPTAALYNYTPHFNSFERIFTNWFGATHNMPIPGCAEATNTTLSCVWKARMPDGSEVITTSHSQIDKYVNVEGYAYVGKAHTVRNPISPSTGNIPIYQLTKSSGATFLTANRAEYDILAANKSSFTAGGVAFYADPAGSNTGYPVYRLYNNQSHQHVWTSNPSDYSSNGFVSEGVAYMSLSSLRQEVAPPDGQSLVYRFRNMPGNRHFWTTDLWERDEMIRAGYAYDGVGWRSSQSATSTPVYRLYAPSIQAHLYTKDAWEKQVLLGNGIWKDEGIAYHASDSTQGSPVYRLYRSQNTQHLFTADVWERQILINQGTFRDEGVAWYQP